MQDKVSTQFTPLMQLVSCSSQFSLKKLRKASFSFFPAFPFPIFEDGLWTRWYKNGQKREEKNYTNDKLMSVEVWKPNGQKCPVTNVKNGNGVVVRYFDDGTEWGRITYKDGKLVKDGYGL